MSSSLCFVPALSYLCSNTWSQTPQISSNIKYLGDVGNCKGLKKTSLFKDNDSANDGILKPLFSWLREFWIFWKWNSFTWWKWEGSLRISCSIETNQSNSKGIKRSVLDLLETFTHTSVSFTSACSFSTDLGFVLVFNNVLQHKT